MLCCNSCMVNDPTGPILHLCKDMLQYKNLFVVTGADG